MCGTKWTTPYNILIRLFAFFFDTQQNCQRITTFICDVNSPLSTLAWAYFTCDTTLYSMDFAHAYIRTDIHTRIWFWFNNNDAGYFFFLKKKLIWMKNIDTNFTIKIEKASSLWLISITSFIFILFVQWLNFCRRI